jgi:predicted transcriptional regulator
MFLSMTEQENTETHIGPFLRHVRSTLGMTLRECANVTHVNFTYLGQVERGERNPSDSWLRSYMESVGSFLADRDVAA